MFILESAFQSITWLLYQVENQRRRLRIEPLTNIYQIKHFSASKITEVANLRGSYGSF